MDNDPYGYARAEPDYTDMTCTTWVLSMIGDAFWALEISDREFSRLIRQWREAKAERHCKLPT